jgi:hypothetical protein
MENIIWFINFMDSFFFLWGKLHDKTRHKMQVKRKKTGRRKRSAALIN